MLRTPVLAAFCVVSRGFSWHTCRSDSACIIEGRLAWPTALIIMHGVGVRRIPPLLPSRQYGSPHSLLCSSHRCRRRASGWCNSIWPSWPAGCRHCNRYSRYSYRKLCVLDTRGVRLADTRPTAPARSTTREPIRNPTCSERQQCPRSVNTPERSLLWILSGNVRCYAS